MIYKVISEQTLTRRTIVLSILYYPSMYDRVSKVVADHDDLTSVSNKNECEIHSKVIVSQNYLDY